MRRKYNPVESRIVDVDVDGLGNIKMIRPVDDNSVLCVEMDIDVLTKIITYLQNSTWGQENMHKRKSVCMDPGIWERNDYKGPYYVAKVGDKLKKFRSVDDAVTARAEHTNAGGVGEAVEQPSAEFDGGAIEGENATSDAET